MLLLYIFGGDQWTLTATTSQLIDYIFIKNKIIPSHCKTA